MIVPQLQCKDTKNIKSTIATPAAENKIKFEAKFSSQLAQLPYCQAQHKP